MPKLRFPEFKSDWKIKRLDSVSNLSAGGTPSTRILDYWGGSIKWMSSGDLNKRIIYDVDGRISQLGLENSSAKLIPKNSVLIGLAGQGKTRGTVAINKVVLTSNQSVAHFKNITEDYQFVYFSLFKDYERLRRLSTGDGGRGGLNLSILGAYKIAFPEITEQLKISKLLVNLDQKINLLTKKKEALETYKKGLMQKIFSQELRFKREDGTDYPDWVSTKIGNHTFKVSEKNKNSESLPIYSITNKGGFVPQSEQFEGVDSSERGYDISMYKIVGKNTFAYNPARINVGSFGYSANLDRVQISSLYVCFKVKPNLSPIYLLQFMSSFKFNKSVLRNVEGGVRQYLFYDNFKNIRIPLPSLNEQEKIVQALNLLDENLASLENAINKTQEFKKGLLQQMFV